jgi:hypothetical protein
MAVSDVAQETSSELPLQRKKDKFLRLSNRTKEKSTTKQNHNRKRAWLEHVIESPTAITVESAIAVSLCAKLVRQTMAN